MAKSSKDIQLVALKDMISQLNTTIKMLNDTISRQQAENDNLKAELAWFKQKMFGSSSERRTDDIAGQISLFDETIAEEKPVELIEPEIVVPALLAGSYVSSSLLAHIAYQKFGLYIPLHRQEKDFLQLNAPITRASMANWIITCGMEYLQPMYDYFHRELLKRRFLMMDETPTQVLKEDGRRAETKSYFWVVRTGEDSLNPIILYNYTPTRAGENIKKFLKGIEPGFYFMTDGYRGYNKLKDSRRCCCWAHVRRYLLEAIPKGMEKDYSNPAVQGVLYCNKLFEYERSYKEKGLSYKQIEKRRLKDQKPVIEGFLSWLKQVNPGSNSKLKKAITYINNYQEYLTTYLEDGRCSLSNNLSENAIRPVTVGRKNWLFSDTAEGAKANALYLTIVEIAKTYNLNLYGYLKFLFDHRPNKDMTDEELENLAPWNARVQELCK